LLPNLKNENKCKYSKELCEDSYKHPEENIRVAFILKMYKNFQRAKELLFSVPYEKDNNTEQQSFIEEV
jgi:hypothetical protein